MYESSTKKNKSRSTDTDLCLTVKATFSYKGFFYYAVKEIDKRVLDPLWEDNIWYLSYVRHHMKQVLHKSQLRIPDYEFKYVMCDYIYKYVKPQPQLWKFIKDNMADNLTDDSHLSANMEYMKDYIDFMNENLNSGECPLFDEIFSALMFWAGKIKKGEEERLTKKEKVIAKQFILWCNNLNYNFDTWHKLHIKYYHKKMKREAEAKIQDFIVSRIFDTRYKIGRHFFDFRLKQDGIDYN